MSNNFDKFAILESFLDEVTSYLPEIESNLDRLQQRPNDTDIIEETYRRAHTIGGSAAMMEYGALSHVAQGMEDILGDALDNNAALDITTIGLLRRSFKRLARLVEHIRSGAENEPIVAEDDADRAAWRGAGNQSAKSDSGVAGGGGSNAPLPAFNRDSGMLQAPDWLSAFAGGGSAAPQQAPYTGSAYEQPTQAPAPTPMPYGGAQPPITPRSDQPFGVSQPYTPQSADPWAASLSNLPTGLTPAVGGGTAGSNETFDEILQSFRADASAPSAFDDARGQGQAPAWGGSGVYGQNAYAPPPPATQGNDRYAPNSYTPGKTFDASAPWPMTPPAPNGLPAQPPQPPMTPMAPQARFQQSQPAAPSAFGMYAPRPESAPLAAPTQGEQRLPMLDEMLTDADAVRRHVGTLRDITSQLRDASQAMEDERLELRGFLDGSRDALDRLEDWAGQQMGLDLRSSPDSVRRYLPLSVIWVTTTRLKRLVGLLNSSGRNLDVTQEEMTETLNELHSAIERAGRISTAFTGVGGQPENGFSATVAHFSWQPPTAPSVESQPSARNDGSNVQALSPGARAEIERTVREQLRRELEDDVRAEIASEVRRDEEERLRQELQIQVRRQLLTELTPMGAVQVNYGQSSVSDRPQLPFIPDQAVKAVRVTSEQSPEALEVFREEAQEHLQTITSGIAQLESTPGDLPTLQSIRRAMHTLKGAAGMMGFTVIQGIAHASEDLLDRFVEGTSAFTSEALSLLLDTSEGIEQLVTGAADDERALQRSLTARYAALIGGNSAAAHDAIAVDVTEDSDEVMEPRAAAGDSSDLSVRLQLSKLDDLVNLFGEILINRSVLEERIERLNRMVGDTVVVSERLREVGSQLESRFEAATLPSGRPGSGKLPQLPPPNSAQSRQRDPNTSWGGAARPGFGGKRDASTFSNEFDELELDRYTEFHRLSRGLSEGVVDIVTLSHEMETLIRESQTSFARENRLSSDLQDRLLKARLVPLQSLIPRLYRTVRASALRESKEVEFFAEGASTEVDRKVYEEVVGPLLHLVRNAVNHGIERPDVRERAGKPRAGKITVSAAYEGNQVAISVRDDGAGINPEHVRDVAIARGWVDAHAQLSEKEAYNLIFQPGITTAESLTEESGRGVGLDVVHDVATRLRGTIEVESTPGQGAVFTMKFPISLQIARAVLVKVGTQTVAIPMAVVDQIGRLDYYQRIKGAQPAIELRNERYPLATLGSYLRIEQNPIEERASLLLVNAGKRRVALIVDGIVSQQEVVAKPLGPHLRDVRGVAGAAVLGNGQVVLILELLELLAQQPQGSIILPEPGSSRPAASTPHAPQPAASAPPPRAPQPTPAQQQAPYIATAPLPPPGAASTNPAMNDGMAPSGSTQRRDFVVTQRPVSDSSQQRVVVSPAGQRFSYILVVDDSPSVRRVVSNMLKAHGWDVQTARDGVEALEVIARKMPAVVLLDIEMPRMDGYELMATVRSQEQYHNLPLVVLTSRAATKHQQRALQLGADAYVVKPYQDEDLLNTLATLAQARQA